MVIFQHSFVWIKLDGRFKFCQKNYVSNLYTLRVIKVWSWLLYGEKWVKNRQKYEFPRKFVAAAKSAKIGQLQTTIAGKVYLLSLSFFCMVLDICLGIQNQLSDWFYLFIWWNASKPANWYFWIFFYFGQVWWFRGPPVYFFQISFNWKRFFVHSSFFSENRVLNKLIYFLQGGHNDPPWACKG